LYNGDMMDEWNIGDKAGVIAVACLFIGGLLLMLAGYFSSELLMYVGFFDIGICGFCMLIAIIEHKEKDCT